MNYTNIDSDKPAVDRGPISSWMCCVLVISAAIMIAIAPHLDRLIRLGDPTYLESGDDVIYLAVARAPFYGESSLRDPFAAPSRHLPTAFAWAQFVPTTAPLGVLQIPFLQTTLAWRVGGAFILGFTLYLLTRRLLPEKRSASFWALVLCLLWLADPGAVDGRPLWRIADFARHWVEGTSDRLPNGYGVYRVVSPLLNLPFVFLIVLGFAATSRSDRRAVLTGLCLGIVTLTYFFFWTAMFGAIGMYLLAAVALCRRSPDASREVRFAAIALIVGLFVGGPQIIANGMTFADPAYREALDRVSLGYQFPADDPLRTHYLRSVWGWGYLLLGAIATWRTRSRLLGLLTLTILAGYMLRTSAIVTGLEFENYHWNYIMNGFGVLLLWTLIIRALMQVDSAAVKAAAIAFAALLVGIAFAHRIYEANNSVESRWIENTISDLTPLGDSIASLSTEVSLVGPVETNVAILFGRCGQLFQTPHTCHRMLISDSEAHERHALNAWLSGISLSEYSAVADGGFAFSMSHSTRQEWQPQAVAARRIDIFKTLEADSGATLMRKYGPLALLRSSTATPLERGGRWTVRAKSNKWSLWTLTQHES
jgi:hypothetical protein